MGEYAIFVWSSYGAVIVLLTFLGYLSWKSKRDDQKKLTTLQRELDKMSKKEI